MRGLSGGRRGKENDRRKKLLKYITPVYEDNITHCTVSFEQKGSRAVEKE
jgi:hypothetical protein